MRMCSIVFLLQLLVATAPASGETTGDTSADSGGRFSRWLDLQAGNVALDYKRARPTYGNWYYQLQYRFLTKGLFRLDQKGRYGVGFRVSTGNYFTFSWNNTAAGRGDFEGGVYLKELYFSASPWKRLEIQFGGGGINRGESTEITSYSNNGYLMGERVTLRYPEKLFFDEITATGAYLGDPYQPGVFQRFHRLGSMNYHQFLVAKKIGRRASVSADYTFQDGTETLREALKVNLTANRVVDSLVFENYERLDYKPAWGCAISLQKNPIPRLTLLGGYVDVDHDYVNWNADRMGKGRRMYISATVTFWHDFSASFYATRSFANSDVGLTNESRWDVILLYDLRKALKRADIL